MLTPIIYLAVIAAVLLLLRKGIQRVRLSRAKHPSLAGHARLSRALARLVPFYEYDTDEAYRCDGASDQVAASRRAAYRLIREQLQEKAPVSRKVSSDLAPAVSDMQFTNANRVPFQFRSLAEALPVGSMAKASDGVQLQDLDGNWSYDVGGSYGVNLLGQEFYKGCIERGAARVSELGPVLGPYHPVLLDNVRMLREVSGLDEISFHMSGTEAVMQAVRLARFHTGRNKLVMFTGAYHGWWDGVQPGVGNPLGTRDVFLLAEMSDRTLKVLNTRRDIACVLVNPIQALNPNRGAGSDAMLVGGRDAAGFDRDAYSRWLGELREICDHRGIALIFDEVFVGFRLGLGGAQDYFGIRADLVTYGKTLGGGLPVGVLCGRGSLMKRYRPDRPTDICFARGTFNSHPYVMASMNEFLRYATGPEFAANGEDQEAIWDRRFAGLNQELEDRDYPVRLRNMWSVAIVTYLQPGRFHWMLQYYLRTEGLALSWIGTGRLIFSHDYTDEDFKEVSHRFLRAAERMQADGWWQRSPDRDDRSLYRQVLKEMLVRRVVGR
jgi:glutamate-1-semialdehyde 2,1-aminomutase